MKPRLSNLLGLLDTRSPRLVALILAITAVVVYGATAVWGAEQNVDAIAAALPAWSVAETGSLVLPEFASANPWVAEGPNGLVSNRPPGVWLLAVPIYFLARPFTSGFTFWPATLTAVLTTATAIGVLFLVLDRTVNRRLAIASTLVVAFGTATWSISGRELWPHGTTQLWLGLSMLALANGRIVLSGASQAFAVLTRPPVVVISATYGAVLAQTRKSLRPLLTVGVPAGLGLACLLMYNRAVFGSWSIAGGYPVDFEARLTNSSLTSWMRNLWDMLLAPYHGVLLWSPIILVLLPAIPTGWKRAPDWARASFVAGVVYLIVHARLNRASGGLAFNYRYPLPFITLATPLLALSWRKWTTTRLRVRLTVFAVLISIAIQFLYVTTMECVYTSETEVSCSIFRP